MSFFQSTLRKQIQSIENDMTIDNGEKSRRKQNLLLLHSLSIGSAALTNSISQSTASSTMSPLAPSFYRPGDTVESVIGKYLISYIFSGVGYWSPFTRRQSVKKLFVFFRECFRRRFEFG